MYSLLALVISPVACLAASLASFICSFNVLLKPFNSLFVPSSSPFKSFKASSSSSLPEAELSITAFDKLTASETALIFANSLSIPSLTPLKNSITMSENFSAIEVK